MFFPYKIIGERVYLQHPQRPTFKLAQELYKVVEASRESVLQWLPWPEKINSPEDEFLYLQNWVHQSWQDRKGCTYIVRDIKNKKILGVLDFLHIDKDNKSGEIGYWLSPSAVGNGYMSEALKILEQVIFKQGYNRIVIRNDTRNTRSVNVAKNSGYHLDGVMRQVRYLPKEKRFIDINIWSKLKDEAK